MKVYFIFYPHGPADKAGFEHEMISIAEGLKHQNVEVFGNVDYWRQTPSTNEYLVRKYELKDLNEFDIVLFSSTAINYKSEKELWPQDLFSEKRKYKLAFIDCSDGFFTPGLDDKFRSADVVLRTHYCQKYKYPKNFVPWQFGLSKRMIEYASPLPFKDRRNVILSNFRVGHKLRDKVESISEKYFYPLYPKDASMDNYDESTMSAVDILYWTQTGRRHYPSFYKRLGESKISNAVGGWLQKSYMVNNSIPNRILRKIDNAIHIFPWDRVVQFDSWRFWESLVSGCCTLHLDFEKYGVKLPVMPINGKHYIGIDLDNPAKTVEVLSNREQLEDISENARQWVLEHYAPLAISKRFLQILKTN